MNELLNIIGLACLVNILVEATPIKWLKHKIGLTADSRYAVVKLLAQLTSCALCLGTYVGMIILMSFVQGAIVAVLAELINRKLNTFEI